MKYLPSSRRDAYVCEHEGTRCPITNEVMSGKNLHLDHCHRTGFVRGCLSRGANTLLGKVENHFYGFMGERSKTLLIAYLARMIQYLNKGDTDVMHWKGATEEVARFSRLSKDDQVFYLTFLGIEPAKNEKGRKDQYLKYLKKDVWDEC